MPNKKEAIGYLPDERPPIWKLLLYAVQQFVVMFPATITVALLTGFHVSTTIFASGLATIFFIIVTKGKLPLYYGSSFSYIAAIVGLMSAPHMEGLGLNEKISIAQFGIVMSGLVSIAAGFIVNRFGKDQISKILPSTITGPIAMVIGLTLAGNALGDASAIPATETSVTLATNMAWIVSLVTLLSTILFSVYLKGFLSQLPLLLGPLVGCLTAFIISKITGVDLFRALDAPSSSLIALPTFTLPKPTLAAVAAIMPIAIATIPESTAHVYQLDVYVNNLAQRKGSRKNTILQANLETI